MSHIAIKKKQALEVMDIQKNGFLVYCAPTGQGKTYFALSNLSTLGITI